jgi:hypothetical protein
MTSVTACQRRSSRRAVLTAYQRRRRRRSGERMAVSLVGLQDYRSLFVGKAILCRAGPASYILAGIDNKDNS